MKTEVPNSSTARRHYLAKFQEENPVSDLFGGEAERAGEEIVSLLKRKDLTHEEAYAGLQYAYNKIRYESNFLQLG